MGDAKTNSHPDCWCSVYLLLLRFSLRRGEALAWAPLIVQQKQKWWPGTKPTTVGEINLYEKVKRYLCISFLPQQYVVKHNPFARHTICPIYVDKLLPRTRESCYYLKLFDTTLMQIMPLQMGETR